jgi:acetyl-CoA carboxylase/biotin carboxylase 1
MYLPLTVTEPGLIRFVQTEGNIVEVGALIATIELDDPSKVQRAETFNGTLPEMKPPAVKGDKPHQVLREAIHSIRRTLAGYHGPNVKKDVVKFFTQIMNPQLPLLEFQECLSR